jgi:hypothetical protein
MTIWKFGPVPFPPNSPGASGGIGRLVPVLTLLRVFLISGIFFATAYLREIFQTLKTEDLLEAWSGSILEGPTFAWFRGGLDKPFLKQLA